MTEQKNYNPLEIKEGLIPRIFNWCKKKARTFQVLATIGVVLAGVEAYSSIFGPDIAEDISKTITATIQDYETLKPVTVPDSLLQNEEICLLKKYQKEFELYRLYLNSLDCSPIDVKSDSTKLQLLVSKFYGFDAYNTEASKLLALAMSINSYEAETAKNESFNKTINISKGYRILQLQEIQNNMQKEMIKSLSYNSTKGFNNLTKKERNAMYDGLEEIVSGEVPLELIKAQTEFYKSFYIATSIRLHELINQ